MNEHDSMLSPCPPEGPVPLTEDLSLLISGWTRIGMVQASELAATRKRYELAGIEVQFRKMTPKQRPQPCDRCTESSCTDAFALYIREN